MKVKLITAACLFLLASTAFAADDTGRWRIDNVRLEPRRQYVRNITIKIVDSHLKTTFTLSNEVGLSGIRETIFYGNKLVLLGSADNTYEAVIYDLLRRKEIDWFDCDGAKQVVPGKLVVAEWQPNHLGGTVLDDVLMLYDLSKTPSANRLKVAHNIQFPLPVEEQSEAMTDSGIPIYPQNNADEGDYFQIPREPGEAFLLVYLDTMVAVSPERLVFVAQRETDASDAVTWLEVLDLPHGAAKAKSRRIEIPKEQIPPDPQWAKLHQPFNPNLMSINQIEVLSPTRIRLHIPAEEYGVDHLDVQIPDRQ
jgi:hypothetical protein